MVLKFTFFAAGVRWDDNRLIKLAQDAASLGNINFQGIYSHDGNSYQLSEGRNTVKEKLGQWGRTASTRMLGAQKL